MCGSVFNNNHIITQCVDICKKRVLRVRRLCDSQESREAIVLMVEKSRKTTARIFEESHEVTVRMLERSREATVRMLEESHKAILLMLEERPCLRRIAQ